MSAPVFLGNFKVVCNDGVADFFDAIGIKQPNDNKLTIKYLTNPFGFGEILTFTNRVSTNLFKLGELREFEDSQGRKVNTIYSLSGNVLTEIRVYNGERTIVIERTFNGDKMDTKYSSDGLKSASAQFEKVE